MSDDQIMTLIANGNIKALEQLYISTYKQVFAFIFSMVKCRHTAEDLMHDTYMRIFEKASAYQTGTFLKTWIMVVAKNITYDYLRKVKPIVFNDENHSEIITFIQTEIFENVVDHLELAKAFKKLAEIDAQIAVLYAVCGFKHREIAQVLSLPEGTVRRRYRKAIKQLHDAMGGSVNG